MPGVNIGSPVTAIDPDEDPLTYILSGTDADLFDLDTSTGQLLTKAALDHETNSSHTVTVAVRDSKDPQGEPDRRRDDSIRVTIRVTNQDDPGVITPSAPTPRVDEPFTVALADPDGGVTGLAWKWDRSPDQTTWTPIDGATTNVYTPTADDQGHHLRITATYTDTLGGNKTATRATDAAVTAGVVTEFQDVAADGVHTPAIKALATQGVFADTECDQSRFCPHEPMQRWVMAIWMIRLLGAEPPAIGTSRFDDIAGGQWWIRHTEQLADRGITIGCDTDPPRYCPNKTVTRAQMATFLVRALKLDPSPPAGFTDTQGNTHQANIDALYAAGITLGCDTDPLRYCPNQPVTRAQMATLLHRALKPATAGMVGFEPLDERLPGTPFPPVPEDFGGLDRIGSDDVQLRRFVATYGPAAAVEVKVAADSASSRVGYSGERCRSSPSLLRIAMSHPSVRSVAGCTVRETRCSRRCPASRCTRSG